MDRIPRKASRSAELGANSLDLNRWANQPSQVSCLLYVGRSRAFIADWPNNKVSCSTWADRMATLQQEPTARCGSLDFPTIRLGDDMGYISYRFPSPHDICRCRLATLTKEGGGGGADRTWQLRYRSGGDDFHRPNQVSDFDSANNHPIVDKCSGSDFNKNTNN